MTESYASPDIARLVKTAKRVTCKKCGADNLIWMKTSFESWYLAQEVPWNGTIYLRGHFEYCNPKRKAA